MARKAHVRQIRPVSPASVLRLYFCFMLRQTQMVNINIFLHLCPIQQTTSEQYLEDKKEDYQDCPVLYCLRFVIVPTTNQKQTYVSSSCR